MTPADLARVIDAYVAGERPVQIALALGLDASEVEAVCAPATPSAAPPPPPPRPKRVRKPVDAPAAPRRARAPAEAGDVADPGRTLRGRDSVTSQRSYGYGYAAVVTGRRPM